MYDSTNNYPNINWSQFSVCNDNPTQAFEDMCRQLFECEFLNDEKLPHSDHNNPGVEVNPILEPPHSDGSAQRRISFQAKYFETNIGYEKIKDSAKKTVKYYSGQLDAVYLFCNKTLSTSSNSYNEVKKILLAAGIDLIPISNSELLDLVCKHKRIGDYFFRQRDRANVISDSSIAATGIPSIGVINGEAVVSINIPFELIHGHHTGADSTLIKDLISEKITGFRSAILDLKLRKLKTELDKMFTYSIDDGEEKETLCFYRFLLSLRDGDAVADLGTEIHSVQYRHDAEWIINHLNSSDDFSFDTYADFLPETQVIILDQLFIGGRWEFIIALYNDMLKDSSRVCEEVRRQLSFYCGLSYFNLADYDKSCDILKELAKVNNENRTQFFFLCAQIQKANRELRYGDPEQNKKLLELLKKFSELKVTYAEQVVQNEVLVAVIELQSYYHLGINDKSVLHMAKECYGSYSESTQNNEMVKFYYAMCLELNGETSNALGLYSSIDWRSNDDFAVRRALCLIKNGESERLVNDYHSMSEGTRTPRINGAYLLALSRVDSVAYHHEVEEAVQKNCEDLEGIFAIAYFIEDKELFCKLIVPIVLRILDNDNNAFLTIDESTRIGFLELFACFDEISLLSAVLDSITRLDSLAQFVVYEIYSTLFRFANREYNAQRNNAIVNDDIDLVERIADRFISEKIQLKHFLQIKVLCAGARRMTFSMLKYSKELFEFTKDAETARQIVALLFERNETDKRVYEPYLDVLMKSDLPDHAMVVASALLKLGRTKEAETYAYKAIYSLNGEDDFEIYKSYFGFYHYNLQNYRQNETKNAITDNTVVWLKECLPEKADSIELDSKEDRITIICLDSESDFVDEDNQSLGIRHMSRKNTNYIKLIGRSVGQVVVLNEKRYKITAYMPRTEFTMKVVYEKIQEFPNEFDGAVWVVSTDDPKKMIEQINTLTNNTKHTELLLNEYHFGSNDLGLPIDSFVSGSYERYITVLEALLFEENQALYSGMPDIGSLEGNCYVPTLSTLVILGLLDRFDVLAVINDSIIIPESYIEFFRTQYEKVSSTQAASFGSLVSLKDGGIAMVDHDKRIPAIWESLVKLSETYSMKHITDDERIDFVIPGEISAERLFSNINIDKIQLDALILSKREKAVYLCDDLFFRKMASYMGVRNLNFASLLYHYTDMNYVMPILLQLSKTNYIYTPFMYRNIEEAQEMFKNLMAGEKKKASYRDYFAKYIKEQEQLLYPSVGKSSDDEKDTEVSDMEADDRST